MKADSKKWKANFRCALNGRADLVELKCCRHNKGKDAYRVYKFLSSASQPGDVTAVSHVT